MADKQAAIDMNIDQIMHSLKSFGFFQISQFLLISSMVIAFNSNVNVIVFAGVHPGYKCKNLTDVQLENFTVINNENRVVYEECSIEVYSDANSTAPIDSFTCLNGYEYTPFPERSITAEWDLVCNKNGLTEVTQTCMILGQSIGAIIFPMFTDKFGRRPLHITCGFFLMLSALLCALSPKYWVFIIGRILTGLFDEGYVISGITAICELFSTKHRSMMTGVYSLIWSSAMTVPASIAYLISNYSWRMYCFYAAVTPVFFIIEIFFLEESIRWLFVNGKVMKAKQVIKKACRQNQTNFDTVWAVAEKELGKTADTYADDNAIHTITVYIPDEKTLSLQNKLPDTKDMIDSRQQTARVSKQSTSSRFQILAIFKCPYTRYITLINIFNWFVVTASYNSIYMLSENLAGNMYLNFVLLASIETFSAGIYCIGIKRFGHKISMVFCEILASVCLTSACLIKIFGANNTLHNTIFRILHLCGMCGVGPCFGGTYIYTPELYPTDVRSVGLGIASSVSRIGSMLAPFSRVLVTYAEWAPSALFGTGLFLSSILMICFMPETSKMQLPQTMAEMNEFGKQKKLKSKIDQVYEKDVGEE